MTSGAANATMGMSVSDPKVKEDLQAFYKARDAIYKWNISALYEVVKLISILNLIIN